MKIQIRITHNGRAYEGEAVLEEAHLAREARRAQRRAQSQSPMQKPSGAVEDLYSGGFFATERSLAETLEQLGQNGYNFSPPSILMALKAKDFLQRRGSKGAYRFVQKYPSS